MKKMIGHYLEVSPQFIHFSTDKFGKLHLKVNRRIKSRSNAFPNFNLSHSKKLIVCAISQKWRVGIDVEQTKKNCLEVMPLVFTEDEIRYVKYFKEVEDQFHAFFWIWTRKEALMKAEGKGFFMHPLSFDVPFSSSRGHNDRYFFFTFQPISGNLISVVTCRDEESWPEPDYKVEKISIDCLLDQNR
ncbi:4'-phosphopantetheinyl transferase superfamily protein [Thermoactinomyces sp. CICC 10522]|nr:4'-phosphopantetheinyl transferase superfamily protein [Thermoactinomyces sp. CICC 10522]